MLNRKRVYIKAREREMRQIRQLLHKHHTCMYKYFTASAVFGFAFEKPFDIFQK